MEANVKCTVLTANDGRGWYEKGGDRLEHSLIYHGWNWDITRFNDWPNDHYDKSCPYTIKAAAFDEAILKYTHILWLDSSVWAVRNPNPIMDVIDSQGYFFHRSGFNCAQVCSDACLEYFGVTRDQAETWPDCSSSMFGLRLGNPFADDFLAMWLQAARDGVFHGSREHDNQSEDPRFKFHRQDQAAASMIINKLGMKMHDPGIYTRLDAPDDGDFGDVLFVMRGM